MESQVALFPPDLPPPSTMLPYSQTAFSAASASEVKQLITKYVHF